MGLNEVPGGAGRFWPTGYTRQHSRSELRRSLGCSDKATVVTIECTILEE